jgi:hypothetical protein
MSGREQKSFGCYTSCSLLGMTGCLCRRSAQTIFSILCGGGVEYLHCRPASCRRQQKGNPMPGDITGPPCSWGDINTGTWPSRLGESQIWDSKMWSWVPWDSNLRMTVLARASSNCKGQIHPLIREDCIKGLWKQVFSWKKMPVVSLRGLVAKINWLAANHQL